MSRFILLLSLCMALNIGAQEDEKDWRLYRPIDSENLESTSTSSDVDLLDTEKGTIRYIQNERIAVVDDYLRSNPIKQDGYRIQLVFGSRGEVSSARSIFLARWRYSAYETYLAPNFRLRVGDFITRFQAEKALRDLKSKFPSAYIVRDKIETPSEFR